MICCSVAGPMLFSFVCKQGDEYKEVTVRHYIRQLISALGYLHCQDIAHLDIKVSLSQWSTVLLCMFTAPLRLVLMSIFMMRSLKTLFYHMTSLYLSHIVSSYD